jgi:hypothetical protein
VAVPVTGTDAPGWWRVEMEGRRSFTHVVTIFVIGGVFDGIDPEIVQYHCDYLVGGSP